jgi:PAS domain S-box-containing protein
MEPATGTDARGTAGLLTEAGRLLAGTLDFEETLRNVARLAIPGFADWCGVDVLEPDGSLRTLSSGHADPRKDALLLELRRRHRDAIRAGRAPADGVLRAVATGEHERLHVVEQRPPELSDEEAALYDELLPFSYLIVPMRDGETIVGALTFIAVRPHRPYTEEDLPVARELGERCAQAVLNARRYDAAESSRALLDGLFATAPVGMAFIDADLRYVLLNQHLADLNGRPVADHVGRTVFEVLGEYAEPVAELLRGVLATGEALVGQQLDAPDGRSFIVSYAPVVIDGDARGVIGAVIETTQSRRAFERTARLQVVTEQLSAALTADEVADVIVRAGMAATGATCGLLAVPSGPGALRFAHRYNMPADAPVELPLAAPAPVPTAVRDRAPVLLGSRAEWVERFPIPPRGGFEAFSAVPLEFEGAVLGCMGLGFTDPREFDEGELALLVSIARQGGQALERARLYEERAYVARTLQEGLLPREVPPIEGLEIAVHYRPLGDGSEVGGDFYDVFPGPRENWIVAVGDVCGKGTQAAVLTGVVRNTIHALALTEDDPHALLCRVNDMLLRQDRPTMSLASAVCGALRRDERGFALVLASGGHPPPLVLRATGGPVEVVEAPGRLLGVEPDPPIHRREVLLAPGDLLLLYTDGVTDARNAARELFGEDRLRAALAGAAGRSAEAAVTAIYSAVRAHAPGPLADDKALVALRVAG